MRWHARYEQNGFAEIVGLQHSRFVGIGQERPIRKRLPQCVAEYGNAVSRNAWRCPEWPAVLLRAEQKLKPTTTIVPPTTLTTPTITTPTTTLGTTATIPPTTTSGVGTTTGAP